MKRATDMGQTIVINVLFLRQGDAWLAQALEFDLAAQGRTRAEAKRAFELTFHAQLMLDKRRGRPFLSTVDRAPQKYWDIFNAISRTKTKLKPGERIRTASRAAGADDLALPPAFMIPSIQYGTQASR